MVRREQEVLNVLTALALQAAADDPFFRFGLVPAQPTLISPLTSMFMHGGIMHLLGNLLILYLCAPYLEDHWGHLLFLGIYMVAGISSGVLHYLINPGSLLPMIGASGAIAGIMGAFLFKFYRNRITFFYWFIVMFGTFELPAWVVLPLWLFKEFFFGVGQATGSLGQTGVAHWAHVGGFLFGFAAAIAIKASHFEAKHLHDVNVDTPIIDQNQTRPRADIINTPGGQEPPRVEYPTDPSRPMRGGFSAGQAALPASWRQTTATLLALSEQQLIFNQEDGTRFTLPLKWLQLVAVGQVKQSDRPSQFHLGLVFRQSETDAVNLINLRTDLDSLKRVFPEITGEANGLRQLMIFLLRHSPARVFPDWNWQQGDYRVFDSTLEYLAALCRSFSGF